MSSSLARIGMTVDSVKTPVVSWIFLDVYSRRRLGKESFNLERSSLHISCPLSSIHSSNASITIYTSEYSLAKDPSKPKYSVHVGLVSLP